MASWSSIDIGCGSRIAVGPYAMPCSGACCAERATVVDERVMNDGSWELDVEIDQRGYQDLRRQDDDCGVRILLIMVDDEGDLSHPRARLLIVGSGPLESALREHIETLSLGGAVQLLGARTPSELAMHLRASDVFVLASSLALALAPALFPGLWKSGC